MAKLVSKLKIDSEKYDLYSSAADVSDEGKIGSWMKVGGVRAYTHTHTGSEKLKIKKNGAAYSPYNKQENVLPESFTGRIFNTAGEAYGGVWRDVPVGRVIRINFFSPFYHSSSYAYIKTTGSPIFFMMDNKYIMVRNKWGRERKFSYDNSSWATTYYDWGPSIDNEGSDTDWIV